MVYCFYFSFYFFDNFRGGKNYLAETKCCLGGGVLSALPLAENQVSNNNYTYAWYTTNMFRHVLQETIRYDELMYRIFVLT